MDEYGEVGSLVLGVFGGAGKRNFGAVLTGDISDLLVISRDDDAGNKFGGQPGSEIQTPMAIVILFGLVSSTFLNMIVVPALYLRFGSVKHRLLVPTDGTSSSSSA